MWSEILYFQMLCIVGVFGYPTAEMKTNDVGNCIHITEDIQKQINSLVNKLSSYIETISAEYDDIDLRTIAFTIDKHSPYEDEKETLIKITVNDCLEGSKETEYIDNVEDDEAFTHNNEAQLKESDDSDRNVGADNQNVTAKGDQEDKEATKRGDEFSKPDSSEKSSSYSTQDHQNKVKDVIKEMRNGEIILIERKKSGEEEIKIESKEKYKNDNKSLDDNNFDNDNDFDKRSDEINKIVDSPKDEAISENEEFNYNNTRSNEKNESDSGKTINKDSQENVKEVYLIDYEELKKVDGEDDDMISSCKEVLLLNDEEKVIFNEIEKARGNKPFMVYQRFFNNLTQFWFF